MNNFEETKNIYIPEDKKESPRTLGPLKRGVNDKGCISQGSGHWISSKGIDLRYGNHGQTDSKDGDQWGRDEPQSISKTSKLMIGPWLFSTYRIHVGYIIYLNLGGGFKYLLFSPLFGEDFQFDSYFADGLKPPT